MGCISPAAPVSGPADEAVRARERYWRRNMHSIRNGLCGLGGAASLLELNPAVMQNREAKELVAMAQESFDTVLGELDRIRQEQQEFEKGGTPPHSSKSPG